MRYSITHDREEKPFSFGREDQFVSNHESFVPQIPSEKGIESLEAPSRT